MSDEPMPTKITHAEQTALIEEGTRFFRKPCTFLQGVASLTQLPDADLPEVCMAGRSNVGKSSLINALTSRKGLARTSDTPGTNARDQLFLLMTVSCWLTYPDTVTHARHARRSNSGQR